MFENQPQHRHLLAATIIRGHPEFIDLPWGRPFSEWPAATDRYEDLPRGASLHPVLFVNYNKTIYALKELPRGMAEQEFHVLRQMQEARLPVVEPVGHVRVNVGSDEAGVLITRYLEDSIPYESLFRRESLNRYRDSLLDAMALLLVQLHVSGSYWGDCSLANTLFRRDAGRLNAYLVDAETSEVLPFLPNAMRRQELQIMRENIYGGLHDMETMQCLPEGLEPEDIVPHISDRYESLWEQVTREVTVAAKDQYRIEERIRSLNELGFSVDLIELIPTDDGQRVRLRAQVTDRNFHRDALHSLTGMDPEELQARMLLNEIHELRAKMSAAEKRSLPMNVAAHRWLQDVYEPTCKKLVSGKYDSPAALERYCQLLEHKWYLSESAQRDVGLPAALADFLAKFPDPEPDDDHHRTG